MMKGREDFYFENYRTVEAQLEIIAIALQKYGDELRKQAKTPTNRWLRNVDVYLDAAEKGTMDSVRVPMLSIESVVAVDLDVVTRLEVQEPVSVTAPIELQEPTRSLDQSPGAGEEDDDGHLPPPQEHSAGQWLCPRTQPTFYGTILGKMRLYVAAAPARQLFAVH